MGMELEKRERSFLNFTLLLWEICLLWFVSIVVGVSSRGGAAGQRCRQFARSALCPSDFCGPGFSLICAVFCHVYLSHSCSSISCVMQAGSNALALRLELPQM